MNLIDWHKSATQKLQTAQIPSAQLDCWLMLEKATLKNKANLIAHDEIILSSNQLAVLDEMLNDRLKHRPMAYILGEVEFYGDKFYVDERVLVPRPETETMIELLARATSHEPRRTENTTKSNLPSTKYRLPPTIIDVGTGSGAIAIIAKKMFPNVKVIAIDIDKKCLKVAKINAKKHSVEIEFMQNDLLEGLKVPKSSIILANLPYVPNNFGINKAALNEPHQAIFGGEDGLDLYRKLFEQLKGQEVIILTESLPPQHKKLVQIAYENSFIQENQKDFIQVFKS